MSSVLASQTKPPPRKLWTDWWIGTAIYLGCLIGILLVTYWTTGWPWQKTFAAVIITVCAAQFLFRAFLDFRQPGQARKVWAAGTAMFGLVFLGFALSLVGLFTWPAWMVTHLFKPVAFVGFTVQWLFIAGILLVMLPNPFRWLKRRRVDPAMDD